jgi:hypothetical protein
MILIHAQNCYPVTLSDPGNEFSSPPDSSAQAERYHTKCPLVFCDSFTNTGSRRLPV